MFALGRPVGELQRGQPGVEAALADELIVPALGDDAALLHDDDAVGAQHRGEAMGDHQGGAAGGKVLERLLHRALGFRVERRGRLVEQQDRRVAQDGAGDREPLALAAGEPHALLAEEGLEALRQAIEELRRRGCLSRGADFGVARLGAAVADVVGGRTRQR